MHSLDRCKRTSQDGGVVIVPASILPTSARAVAIAVDPSGRRIVQTREPSTLLVEGHTVVLPGETRKDTGHDLFHFGTVGGIACASCHPEGREDGHVWTFEGFGPRRTQSISGGVRGTEPFHWDGDMNDFQELANDVFSARMTGPLLRSDHVAALAQWIDLIPQLEAPAPSDAGAVERGKALFNDSVVGCATCHSGAKLTNNQSRAVGTGGVFQVPSLLGLGWRAPYMHHGRVATIADRFTAWGGGDEHGHVSSLAATEQADLVAYLESL